MKIIRLSLLHLSVKLFCYTSDGLALLMKLANIGTYGTKPYGTMLQGKGALDPRSVRERRNGP